MLSNICLESLLFGVDFWVLFVVYLVAENVLLSVCRKLFLELRAVSAWHCVPDKTICNDKVRDSYFSQSW